MILSKKKKMSKTFALLAFLLFWGNFFAYAEKKKNYIEVYQTGHADKSTLMICTFIT